MTVFARLGRCFALSAAITFIAGVTGPVAHVAAAPCPDVYLVFARGTSEPPGLGRVGTALVDELRPRLNGRTLGAYAVDYPATMNFLHTADGARDAAAHIADMAKQCPSTRVVLGGYSQGAAVVAMLAGVPPVGDIIGSIGSAKPLVPANAARVAAVAVFGNPSTRFGSPLSTTGQFAGRTMDLCSPGDPICYPGGRDGKAHLSYVLPPYSDQAAVFVAGRL